MLLAMTYRGDDLVIASEAKQSQKMNFLYYQVNRAQIT